MLLKVAHNAENTGLVCTVAPMDVQTGRARATKVTWSEIAARNVPIVNDAHNGHHKPMDPINEDPVDEDPVDEDPVDRFFAEARYSKVTAELPDGRRRVTVKDHETGEMTETIKPPR